MSKGYYTTTRVTDYGPYITKIILPIGKPIKAGKTLSKKFSVYVERLDDQGNLLLLPKSWMAKDDKEPSCGYLPIRDAYPSTKEGDRLTSGTYLTLETAYGPAYSLAAPITSIDGMNAYIHQHLIITQTAPITSQKETLNGMVFDYSLGNTCPDTYGWINVLATDTSLGYGYFVPQIKNGGKRPLIVWLHGAGEGGYDPTIAYTGNKVVNFSTPEIQSIFGGAYVLTPQAPTFWMNDGSGQYHAEGVSIYVEALKACIDDFVSQNPGIDTDRIYLGGDSNGGFMTMRMTIDYPDYFAASFPTCEALYDATISDADIQSIKDCPIWFIHAKNDPIVDPNTTVLPTYQRLLKAGAKNVHFTFWDKIEDIRGAFDMVDGKPFEYFGHFAWVHVYNNDCQVDYNGKPAIVEGKEVGLLEWLSLQKK